MGIVKTKTVDHDREEYAWMTFENPFAISPNGRQTFLSNIGLSRDSNVLSNNVNFLLQSYFVIFTYLS